MTKANKLSSLPVPDGTITEPYFAPPPLFAPSRSRSPPPLPFAPVRPQPGPGADRPGASSGP